MAKRITAVTGEYQNQQGEQKAEFTNIGVLGVSSQGKEYVLLDPAISLSGVLAKQNALAVKRGEQPRDMIMCSVFDNDNQQQQPQQQQQQQQQGGYQNQQMQQPQQMQQQGHQYQQNQSQQPQYNNAPQNFDDDRR